MTVATWSLPLNNVDTPSAYKAKLDGNPAVAQRIVDCLAPHAQTSPNMTVALDAGAVFNGSTLTEVAAQNTGTITAPATNPRIDRIVVDRASGAVSVITGTPAGSPTAPAFTAGKLPIAQVLLQTTSTTITNAMITDERALNWAGLGTAAAVDTGTSGATVPLLNGTNTHSGALTMTGILAMSGKALNEAGATDIASATTTNIGAATGNNVNVTGTTTITGLGTVQRGTRRIVTFTGALTLTHNASSLILPGGANITTAANDVATFVSEGSGNWRCVSYTKATGQAVVAAAQIFSAKFTSSEQTPPGVSSSLTVAHGLGAVPFAVEVVMRCKTTESGYAVGQEIVIASGPQNTGGLGIWVSRDATNVVVSTANTGTTPYIGPPAAGGAAAYLTIANWKMVIRAWL